MSERTVVVLIRSQYDFKIYSGITQCCNENEDVKSKKSAIDFQMSVKKNDEFHQEEYSIFRRKIGFPFYRRFNDIANLLNVITSFIFEERKEPFTRKEFLNFLLIEMEVDIAKENKIELDN